MEGETDLKSAFWALEYKYSPRTLSFRRSCIWYSCCKIGSTNISNSVH